METSLHTSSWTRRNCPICERSDLFIEIGTRTIDARQRSGAYQWRQIDGVCSGCGLIQSLETPEPAFLDGYYADAHTVRSSAADAQITPGFDVTARMSPIRRLHTQGRLVEIGAGDGTFSDLLRKEGFDAMGIDPLSGGESDSVVSGYASQLTVDTELAATVVAYDVLEHAADALDWLRTAAALLKPDGVLILEVPDTDNWPVEAWHHEHLTQFTTESLQLLCEHVGFETISCGAEPPSRPHGIIYVGRKTGLGTRQKIQDRKGLAAEVAHARDLYTRADRIRRHQQEAARETANQVLNAISSNPRSACEVVVWGANEIASAIGDALLDTGRDLKVRIVDNADSKTGVPHPGFRTPIERPTFESHDDSLWIFVLCSRNWNGLIADQITGMGIPSTVIIDGTNWPAE